ncbi:MAG TPA: hypothetical protein VJH95_03260 [Candidatus Nanoarchaeia archaeon]|nr:hypothetical protein [Candidatus Nanoarchaeia archaeon]
MKLPWNKDKEEKLEDKEKEEILAEISSQPAGLPENSAHDNRIDRLEIEIERLKAIFGTSNDYRKTNEERLSRINESIGELRSSMIEREKQVKDLEIAALRSADLVKEVQPEKLMLEVRKTGSKAEVLSSKLESYDSLISNIIEEIKSIRRLTAEFESMESIHELNSEIRAELGETKRRETKIEIESSKISKIFEEMQKKYAEQQEMNSLLTQAVISNTELKKDTDALKVRFSTLIDKDELSKIKTEIKELLSESGLSQHSHASQISLPKSFSQKPSPQSSSGLIDMDKKLYILESKTQRELDSLKSLIAKSEASTNLTLDKELSKIKSSSKELEKTFAFIQQDTQNPVYQKLKRDVFTKLSYYDVFLSDTAVKLPMMEKELFSLKAYLKSVIMKNQEILAFIKGSKALSFNPEEFIKRESFSLLQEKINFIEEKLSQLSESLTSSSIDISKRLHELNFNISQKADKTSIEELKDLISSRLRRNEVFLHSVEENLTSLISTTSFAEIPKIKEDLTKIKLVLRDIIRRDEEWMNSIFKMVNQ